MFMHGYSHPLVLVQTSSWEPYLEYRKGQVWQLLLPDLEGRTVLCCGWVDVEAELKLVHNKVSVLQSPEFRTCIFEIFPPSVWSEEGGWLGWGWGAG